MNFPFRYVCHGERGRISCHFGQMLGAARFVGAQVEFSRALFDGVDQRLDQRTLRSGPLRDLIDQRLAMLMEKFAGRERRLLALRYRKQIAQDQCQA